MDQTDPLVLRNPATTHGPGTEHQVDGRLLIGVASVGLLLAFGIAHGIRSRQEAAAGLRQAAQMAAIPVVEIVHPQPATAGQHITLPGKVQAFHDTPIYARTSGYVEHWYVDIGAHVKEGQLLALVQTPELDRQLQAARADLKSEQASLEIARMTAERWPNLLTPPSVSQQETDQAVSNFSSRQAAVESGIANVERLERLQSFERITAPFEGVITGRNVEIGALIQAGDNAAPKELFHLASVRQLRVYIAVPEIYAAYARNGESVSLTLDAFPNETFVGTVVRNAAAIDLSARTLSVEVDVDNSAGRLFPGAYAFVHFTIPVTGSTVSIPSNALLFRSEGLRAGVVSKGHVVLRPIAIGQDHGSVVEIVSGLTTADAVIVNPSDSLADGAAVRTRTQQAVSVARQ